MKFLLLTLALVAAVLARPSPTPSPSPTPTPAPDVSHILGNAEHRGFSSYDAPTSSINADYQQFIQQSDFLPNLQSAGVPDGDVDFSLSRNYGLLEKDFAGFADLINQSEEEISPENVKHTKQVFFYAAPEPEEPQYLQIRFAPSQTKNTNVIFVKAPTQGPVIPQIIPPKHNQLEDKTKVYVFVKETDTQGKTLTLPAPLPPKTKPEVFIVKYKNQEEAQRVISSGVSEGGVGNSMPDIKDESAFVRNLNGPGGFGFNQGIGFQPNPFIESDLRFGAGRSIPPSTINVRVNDEENTSVKKVDNDDKDESFTTATQQTTESISEATSASDLAQSGVNDVKKNTIASIEDDLNQSSSDSASPSSDDNSGALADKSSNTQNQESSDTSVTRFARFID